MSVVTGLIKLFFGTKSEKDRKAIQPYVDKIKAIYPSIEQLTVDELRARSAGLKAAIAEDEGASYFGEVALVPYDSPISKPEDSLLQHALRRKCCLPPCLR